MLCDHGVSLYLECRQCADPLQYDPDGVPQLSLQSQAESEGLAGWLPLALALAMALVILWLRHAGRLL